MVFPSTLLSEEVDWEQQETHLLSGEGTGNCFSLSVIREKDVAVGQDHYARSAWLYEIGLLLMGGMERAEGSVSSPLLAKVPPSH